MSNDHEFDSNVFVNCPFDNKYEPVLQAILFCLIRLGLTPRIAKERIDSGESRISKILELIQSSRYSIHDLCRCKAEQEGEYYRLNMPFELGLDFGCRYYGEEKLKSKSILILEEQQYRYQAAISDIAGYDIEPHEGNYKIAVAKVRDWFAGMPDFEAVAPAQVLSDYEDFQEWSYGQIWCSGSLLKRHSDEWLSPLRHP